MWAVAKDLRARASEPHSSNLCKQFEPKAKFCEHFWIEWNHSVPLLPMKYIIRHAEILNNGYKNVRKNPNFSKPAYFM